MKKYISFFVMSILLVGLLAACGQGGNNAEQQGETKTNSEGTSEKKVLKMGTSADFPPFEFVDTAKGEEIIGFDADLAKAITEKLGYELEVQDMDFAGLIEALNSGKVDFVLSGMSATEERKASVDFTDTYYTANNMIITQKDSPIKTVEDLAGKKVGVQLGSIQEEKANEIKETVDITIDSRNRVAEIIQELKTGRFAAIVLEDVVAKGFLAKNEDLSGFNLPPEAEENGFAASFPKGNEELVAEFNRVIGEMKENGELDQLVKKWMSE